MCATSCAITLATQRRSRLDDVGDASSAVSRYVMSPQFSMAPALKSGMATRSSLGSAKGTPKAAS